MYMDSVYKRYGDETPARCLRTHTAVVMRGNRVGTIVANIFVKLRFVLTLRPQRTDYAINVVTTILLYVLNFVSTIVSYRGSNTGCE